MEAGKEDSFISNKEQKYRMYCCDGRKVHLQCHQPSSAPKKERKESSFSAELVILCSGRGKVKREREKEKGTVVSLPSSLRDGFQQLLVDIDMEIEKRQHAGHGAPASSGGVPSMFELQKMYWAVVGAVIAAATVANLLNKLIAAQR
jgi:hypothetical protein